MTDFPKDVWLSAIAALNGHGEIRIFEVIAEAILAERERCTEICAAEREWGGNVEDAQTRIEKGEPPRKIEGWNAPYEEDEA